jgi:SAM-dependent methyltransferase
MKIAPEKWLERQRRCWDYAAKGCAELGDWLEHHYEPVTQAMLRLAPPVPGGSAVELACGTGLLSRRLAQMTGSVLGLDISPEMIAHTRPAPNVRYEGRSAEEPIEGKFDRAYSRFGIMFCPDVPLVLRNVAAAVNPRGLFAFAVWGPASQNQWAEAVAGPLLRYHGLESPGPEDPNAFRLDDPAEVLMMLRSAGWSPIACEPVLVLGWGEGGPAMTWERLQKTAGPIGTLWERTPNEDRPNVEKEILAALDAIPPGGLTGVAWVYAAQKS